MTNHVEQHDKAQDAHLLDYWKIIWQGRFTVLTIIVLALTLSTLRVLLTTPVYEATALIEIRPEARRILQGQEQFLGAQGVGWIAEEKYFNTQLEVLHSRDLARETLIKLPAADRAVFEEAADPVAAFAAKIRVRPKAETRLVELSMSGSDAAQTSAWTNLLADTYVERNVRVARDGFVSVMEAIGTQMEDFKGDLGEADTARLQMAKDQDFYVPENQEEILRQSLARYNDELSSLNLEMATLDSQLASLGRIEAEGGDLLAMPSVARDRIIGDLYSQKIVLDREIDILAREKKPGHPEYSQKSDERRQLERKIESQVVRLIAELGARRDVVRDEAGRIAGRISETRRELFRVEEITSRYDIATSDAKSKMNVYDSISETMAQLNLSAQLIMMNNNVGVLDPAIAPQHPIKPRKVLGVLFGGMLGVVFGVGAVLFLDYLDNTIRTPEEVERYLGLSVLSIVPRESERTIDAVKEAYQSLRTSVLFSSHNREKRIVLFTSAGPQEGKSTTVAKVARTMAAAGESVLVIDCDLRRPTQHKQHNVPRQPGVTNYLLAKDDERGDLRTYAQRVGDQKLWILPCGPIPPNPTDLIGQSGFRDLLAKAREEFEWVIIDSPPILNLSDAVVLASLVEMIVFVVKQNENDRDLVRRSVRKVREINPGIVGAVLNGVEFDRGFYRGYYAGYYSYEGSSSGAEASPRRDRGLDSKPGNRVAL